METTENNGKFLLDGKQFYRSLTSLRIVIRICLCYQIYNNNTTPSSDRTDGTINLYLNTFKKYF